MAQLGSKDFLKQQIANAIALQNNLEKQINGFDTTINDVASKLDPDAKRKVNELRADAQMIFNKAREGENTDKYLKFLKDKFNLNT